MARKLQMGIVGLGGIWNWAHSEILKAHPEVEIVAVCDIVEEKAARWSKEVGARAYTDYNENLARPRIGKQLRLTASPVRSIIKQKGPTTGVAGLQPQRKGISMLYTVVVVLLILWLLGLVSGNAIGGLIHILLVVAIVVILLRVIQGRRG